MALSIFEWSSFLIELKLISDTSFIPFLNDREQSFGVDNFGKGARFVDREDNDRNVVFTRQCDGGRVHDLKIVG